LANVLAWKTRRDAIHVSKLVASDPSDIFKLSGMRKSVGKDSPVDGVDFDLPGCAPSRRLESDVEAADAREE
jgi:hypothetical protein